MAKTNKSSNNPSQKGMVVNEGYRDLLAVYPHAVEKIDPVSDKQIESLSAARENLALTESYKNQVQKAIEQMKTEQRPADYKHPIMGQTRQELIDLMPRLEKSLEQQRAQYEDKYEEALRGGTYMYNPSKLSSTERKEIDMTNGIIMLENQLRIVEYNAKKDPSQASKIEPLEAQIFDAKHSLEDFLQSNGINTSVPQAVQPQENKAPSVDTGHGHDKDYGQTNPLSDEEIVEFNKLREQVFKAKEGIVVLRDALNELADMPDNARFRNTQWTKADVKDALNGAQEDFKLLENKFEMEKVGMLEKGTFFYHPAISPDIARELGMRNVIIMLENEKALLTHPSCKDWDSDRLAEIDKNLTEKRLELQKFQQDHPDIHVTDKLFPSLNESTKTPQKGEGRTDLQQLRAATASSVSAMMSGPHDKPEKGKFEAYKEEGDKRLAEYRRGADAEVIRYFGRDVFGEFEERLSKATKQSEQEDRGLSR